ncbi:MAG: hypothetical protein KR126chlam4_00808 [Candidatus Anoxychlamydiales bacterium]|nr:hypothetical protein [Candidatus Anoxychlamydiales bacterium]
MNLSHILGSYDSYCNFMKGEQPISHLKKIAETGVISNAKPYRKIKLIWKVFKESALMLFTAGRCFEAFSSHYCKEKNAIEELKGMKKTTILGNEFLVKSHNRLSYKHQKDSVIPISNIDKKLKSYLLEGDKPKKVLDLNEHGICRGMSEWFAYLYFKTLESFKNKPHEFHVKAIAENFKKGSPIEGALLQKFPNSISIRPPIFFEALYAQKFKNPLKKREESIKILKKLPLGIYDLNILASSSSETGHDCILIKESSDLIYFWEPNNGLIKIKGSNIENSFFEEYEKVLKSLYDEIGDKTLILVKMEPTYKKYYPRISEISSNIYIFDARKAFFGERVIVYLRDKFTVFRYLFNMIRILTDINHYWNCFILPPLFPIYFIKFCFERNKNQEKNIKNIVIRTWKYLYREIFLLRALK